MNNAALGFSLLLLGLAVFASALNKTTGSMIAGLLYGEGALKAPGQTQAQKDAAAVAANPLAVVPPGGVRAGVVPVGPDGKIPGITAPFIDPSKNA